jgi:glycine betaine transporter
MLKNLRFMKENSLTTGLPTAVLCMSLLCLFVGLPQETIEVLSTFSNAFIGYFNTSLILLCSAFTVIAIAIAISPLGRMVLGGETAMPAYHFSTWLAMLFTAGMGSGLVFSGIAEPVFHTSFYPRIGDYEAPEMTGLALTYFHWGVHAWGIYVIAGLAMGWFAFNRQRQMQISACFTDQTKPKPWFGLLNMSAVIAIMFGVAGTLANSIALIQSGVEKLVDVELTLTFRLALLFVIALIFTLSSLRGIQQGIAQLSKFNLYLFVAILSVVIWIADPLEVLKISIQSSAEYISMLPTLSTTISPETETWSNNWSVNYFIWWIAWAPFVGTFIAIISRGRTIRAFILWGIFMPTLASILWFSAFAAGVLKLPDTVNMSQVIAQDYTQGLFVFFADMPSGVWLIGASLLLLMTFVITSADSACYVIDTLLNTQRQRSYLWGAILVTIAGVLLINNNIDLNRQVAIVGAFPYIVVLLLQMLFCIKDMYQAYRQPNE